ncbi:MAG: LAGLIDADG family homing endonuclease, partial [Candidatus Hodarchaeota archaeon]
MPNFYLYGLTNIFLEDGTISTIDNLSKKINEDLREGRFRIALLDANFKITFEAFSSIEKICSQIEFLKIKTRSGGKITVRKSQKILVDTLKGPNMIPAENLGIKNEIYSSDHIPVLSKNRLPSLLEVLQSIRGKKDIFVTLEEEITKEINHELKEKYDRLRKACQELNIKYNRITDRYHKRRYKISELKRIGEVFEWNKNQWSFLLSKTKFIGTSKNRIKISENFDLYSKNFFYVLGLIASDGFTSYNERYGTYRIGFTNKSKELIDKFEKLCYSFFPSITITPSQNQDGVHISEISNYILMRLVEYFGVKGETLEIEAFYPIFKMPKHLIAAFLQGYLDGDGTINMSKPSISFIVGKSPKSESPEDFQYRSKNLQLLLKR